MKNDLTLQSGEYTGGMRPSSDFDALVLASVRPARVSLTFRNTMRFRFRPNRRPALGNTVKFLRMRDFSNAAISPGLH
jgi:hypothetical protein